MHPLCWRVNGNPSSDHNQKQKDHGGDGDEHILYGTLHAMKWLFFIICLVTNSIFAADVSGKWDFEIALDAGSGNPKFEFQQKGEILSGTYTGLLGSAAVSGAVKGNNISFAFDSEYSGEKFRVVYEGVVEDSKSMKGTVKLGSLGSGTFTAKKS